MISKRTGMRFLDLVQELPGLSPRELLRINPAADRIELGCAVRDQAGIF